MAVHSAMVYNSKKTEPTVLLFFFFALFRCYEEALSMYKKCLEDEGPLHIGQDAARIKFLKYSQVRMKNNIAISAGCLGNSYLTFSTVQIVVSRTLNGKISFVNR